MLLNILFVYQNFGLCDIDIEAKMMQINPLKKITSLIVCRERHQDFI